MRVEPVRSAVGPAGSGLDASDLRIAVFAAEFNAAFVEPMLDAARAAWSRAGGAPTAFVARHVPGAFELPLACREAARTGRYHAVVALGCVIRGDTRHYEHVADRCAEGLMRVALDFGIPVMRHEESKKQSPNRLFSTSDDSPVRFDSLHKISESSMRMQSAGIISPDCVDIELITYD